MWGRRGEIEAIELLLERARASSSGVLHLVGEAGVGKTALCTHAITSAEDMTVVHIIGSEWESQFALTAVGDIVRRLRHWQDQLIDSQRDATAALLGDVGRPGVDQYALAGAALALLATEAVQQPVLLVIDDAHWLDPESANVLAFVVKRLEADRVAVLLASRADYEPSAFDTLPATVIGGLGRAEATGLLEERLADRPTPSVTDHLVDLTGGNPLALIELAGGLSPDQLAGRAALPDPLPLGARGRATFGRLVNGLSPSTRLALVVVAGAGAATFDTVLEAMTQLDLRPGDLEPAEDAGVVQLDGGQIAFRHPLVRAAVYSEAANSDRRRAHTALAAALQHDVERRAWHLAAASVGPSEAVAQALDEAAEQTMLRAGAAAAAGTRCRAADVSPPGSRQTARALLAVEALYLAGQWAAAIGRLDAVLATASDPSERSEATVLQAKLAMWSPNVGTDLLLVATAFDQLARDGDANAIPVGLQLVNMCMTTGRLPLAGPASSRLMDLTPAAHPLRESVVLFDAVVALMTGRAGPPPLSARRLSVLIDQLSPDDLGFWAPTVAFLWNWCDRHEEAAALVQRQLDVLHSRSAAGLLPFPLALLADIRLQAGDLVRASAAAEQAIELGTDARLDSLVALVRAQRAISAAVSGDARRCIAEADAADTLGRRHGQTVNVPIFTNMARGHLALARAQPAEAVKHLEENEKLAHAEGLVHPKVARWQGDYIEALVRVGAVERAWGALARLDEASHRTSSRWGRSVAYRCRALLEPERAIELLTEAMDLQHDAPVERARSQLVLGEHLRRAGQMTQARPHLVACADYFREIGAELWAARAESQLRATGVRRSRAGTHGERLTEQELQVALAVADGATNREAAATLFLSQKTVEYHLAKAFRKLGVTNRTQLAARLRHQGPVAQSTPNASDD